VLILSKNLIFATYCISVCIRSMALVLHLFSANHSNSSIYPVGFTWPTLLWCTIDYCCPIMSTDNISRHQVVNSPTPAIYCTWWTVLGFVYFVLWCLSVCWFCCVRFSVFSTMLSDGPGRTHLNWDPFLCRVDIKCLSKLSPLCYVHVGWWHTAAESRPQP